MASGPAGTAGPSDVPARVVRRRAVPPLLDASWRVLLGVVVATLVALVVGPLVTSRQVRALRATITDEVDPARLRASDVRAALATQMVALGEVAQGDHASGVARYHLALTTERASTAALDTLAARLGPDAIGPLTDLRTASAVWHARVGPLLDAVRADSVPADTLGGAAAARAATQASVRADSLGDLADDALAAVDATARLERVLDRVAARQRARIADVERVAVALPLVLVPFAVGSALVVWWAGRRLVALAEEAERGRRALADSAAARAALMRGVTHDLKNPLGAAQGYADLLTDGILGPLGDEQRRTVERVRGLIARTLAAIQDLGALSASTAGTLPLAREPVDVAAEVRDVVHDYAAAAHAAGVALRCEPPPPLSPVTTDALRVRQALGNLLSNACKYAPDGEVVVSVACHPAAATPLGRAAVAVAVRDTGPGIPPELHARIFEEFYRVPGDSARAEGTGVGLAISRRTARLLGGDLTVTSTPGRGSTFVLWLPSGGPVDAPLQAADAR